MAGVDDIPAFARGGGIWQQQYSKDGSAAQKPSEIFVVLPDVSLHCKRRWWGRQWTLVGTSTQPWGERLTLLVARDRVTAHGYWRDVIIDDEPFDSRYFIYCDVPALARVLLGPATRNAIAASDDPSSPCTLALHAHDDVIETDSIAAFEDAAAAAHHAAVHRALAADAARLDAYWQRMARAFGGVVTRRWPPRLVCGALQIDMSWDRPDGQAASNWHAAADSLATVVAVGEQAVRIAGIATEVQLRAAAAQAERAAGLHATPYR